MLSVVSSGVGSANLITSPSVAPVSAVRGVPGPRSAEGVMRIVTHVTQRRLAGVAVGANQGQKAHVILPMVCRQSCSSPDSAKSEGETYQRIERFFSAGYRGFPNGLHR